MKDEKTYDLLMVIVVTFLTCWFFWEIAIRSYVENYIDKKYGIAIIETNNNGKLILELNDNNRNKKTQ